MLKTPAKKIEKYSEDFGEYLTKSARKEGEGPKYTKQDLVTLGRIRKYRSQRKSTQQIKYLLKEGGTGRGSLAARIDQAK